MGTKTKITMPDSISTSNYKIGSALCCSITSRVSVPDTPQKEAKHQSRLCIDIDRGATLRINTISTEATFSSHRNLCDGCLSFTSSDSSDVKNTVPLIHLSSSYQLHTSLAIEVSGPRKITFDLELTRNGTNDNANATHSATANIIGSIVATPWIEMSSELLNQDTVRVTKTEADDACTKVEELHSKAVPATNDTSTTQPVTEVAKTVVDNKRKRAETAKQKNEELQTVLRNEQQQTSEPQAPANDDSKSTETLKPKSKKLKQTSKAVLSLRRLKSGIILKEQTIGSGALVKSGRKVSINYVATLQSTGETFDKNQSKVKPLTFRLGTGEMIRGLEMGLEGMREGGERTVVIPPALGYGKTKQKGGGIHGNVVIPKNSTLVFEVKLASVGTKSA